jgi:hypothetical protein
MRYAGNMAEQQRPYPSDLSDARWELIQPVLSAWRTERRGNGLDIGRPCEHDLRAILNAILYVDRTSRPLALPAARVPTLADRLRLLRPLADRRHLLPAQRPPPTMSTHR